MSPGPSAVNRSITKPCIAGPLSRKNSTWRQASRRVERKKKNLTQRRKGEEGRQKITKKDLVRQLPMRVKIRNGVIERRAFERGWFDRSESRNGKSRRKVGASLGEGKRQLREAYGSNRQRF